MQRATRLQHEVRTTLHQPHPLRVRRAEAALFSPVTAVTRGQVGFRLGTKHAILKVAMSRTVRALVALLALVGLVSPLLGACLCAEMARTPKAHDCCPGDETSRLQVARNCCSVETRSTERATLKVAPALAAPVAPTLVADVPALTSSAAIAPQSLYLPIKPLVLRI